MITIEKKVDVFTKLVLEKVQQEFQQKRDEINIKNYERIHEYKKKFKKAGERIAGEMVKKGEVEKNKMISKANLMKKKTVLYKRQELMEELIENLRKRAAAFVEEDKYEEYFKNSMSGVLTILKDEGSIRLYIREQDMIKNKNFILNKALEYGFTKENIRILPLDVEAIGGIIGTNQNMTIRLDSSIAAIIDDHHNLIGQRLYDALKAGGGLNG